MESKKKNIIIESAVNFFKGIVFGIANVIPGVSGGTIAVIMGIFERIIFSVNNLFKSKKDFVRSFVYLAPIALGAAAGIFGFANLITLSAKHFPLQTNLFFAGLIVGSLPYLLGVIYPRLRIGAGRERKSRRDIEKIGQPVENAQKSAGFSAWHAPLFLSAAGLVIGLAFIMPQEKAADVMGFWDYALLPAAGFIAAVAMIIPGVSGSFMLKLMGVYMLIVGAVGDVFGSANSILILGIFAAGVIIGVWAAAKIISVLFKRFKTASYVFILGLVAGCAAAMFIQPEMYGTATGIWGIAAGAALFIAGAAAAVFTGIMTVRGEIKKEAEQKETAAYKKNGAESEGGENG